MPALDSISKKTPDGHGLSAPSCSAFFYVYGYDATHPVKLGHTKSLSSRLSNVKTLSEIDGKYLKTLQLPDKFFAKELERALLHLTWSWTAGKREMRRLPLPVFNWLVNLDILDAGIVLEDCHPKECSLDGLLSESQKQILPERKARFLRVKKANEAVGALFYKPNAKVADPKDSAH